jgi:hypothetical protein
MLVRESDLFEIRKIKNNNLGMMEHVLKYTKLFHLLMKQHSIVIVKMVIMDYIVNYLKICVGI